jgi:hypothetical protein
MSGTIYLVHGKDQLVEMNESPYSSEDLLQTLLADYPNLLAGDQMDSGDPRRWSVRLLAVSRSCSACRLSRNYGL